MNPSNLSQIIELSEFQKSWLIFWMCCTSRCNTKGCLNWMGSRRVCLFYFKIQYRVSLFGMFCLFKTCYIILFCLLPQVPTTPGLWYFWLGQCTVCKNTVFLFFKTLLYKKIKWSLIKYIFRNKKNSFIIYKNIDNYLFYKFLSSLLMNKVKLKFKK